MVVVFVVIGALLIGSRNNAATSNTAANVSGAASGSAAGAGSDAGATPNVVLEPEVAAALTAAAGNPKVLAAQTALASHTNITPVAGGVLAPDFNLPANDGKNYTLSQFRGKTPVFIEFLAPWCPHCQEDSKIFNEVYDLYQGKNLQMLGISAHPYGRDWQDKEGNPYTATPISMDDLTWFATTFNVKYPLLLDTAIKSADDYGIMYYPTVYIIDKNGNVSTMITAERDNPITVERLKGELDKVVQQ
jgi:cytochrome c-type biogenesis protein